LSQLSVASDIHSWYPTEWCKHLKMLETISKNSEDMATPRLVSENRGWRTWHTVKIVYPMKSIWISIAYLKFWRRYNAPIGILSAVSYPLSALLDAFPLSFFFASGVWSYVAWAPVFGEVSTPIFSFADTTDSCRERGCCSLQKSREVLFYMQIFCRFFDRSAQKCDFPTWSTSYQGFLAFRWRLLAFSFCICATASSYWIAVLMYVKILLKIYVFKFCKMALKC